MDRTPMGDGMARPSSHPVQPIVVRAVLPDGRISTGGWVVDVVQEQVVGAASRRVKAGADGSVRLDLPAPLPSLFPITFQWRLTAHGRDRRGVIWSGTVVEYTRMGAARRRLPLRNLYISVSRQPRQIDRFGLGEAMGTKLQATELGRLVLYEIGELHAALTGSLPSAALELASKVLDTFLKLRGHEGGWWPKALDTAALGTVLKNPDVVSRSRAAIGDAAWGRLEQSVLYRRATGAIPKYVEISIETAEADAEMVLETLKRWP